MIHVLMDEGQLVGVVEGIDTPSVIEATRKVDEAFRKLADRADPLYLEQQLCEALGMPWDRFIQNWHDVLMLYLIQKGATRVDYIPLECVPKNSTGWKKEEG